MSEKINRLEQGRNDTADNDRLYHIEQELKNLFQDHGDLKDFASDFSKETTANIDRLEWDIKNLN